jgi:hypothetical protein
MSAVNARIQGIEDTLKKLLDVVDKHGSPGRRRSAKSRKPSQPPWKTIRSIIEKLAQDVQNVKEMVEGSGNSTGHDRSTEADDGNATPKIDYRSWINHHIRDSKLAGTLQGPRNAHKRMDLFL